MSKYIQTKSIRRIVLDSINSTLSSSIPPIIVASMGRSGSTLVFDSISDSLILTRALKIPRFLSKSLIRRGGAWNLSTTKFYSGVAYKTHSFPCELPAVYPGKVIFIYGDPIDAALSILNCRSKYGEIWYQKHLSHLHVDMREHDRLDNQDPFRFEEQIDSWMNQKRFESLILRYETLWENEMIISDFVGFPVKLPSKVSRSPYDLGEDLLRTISLKYSKLREKVISLPDAVIINN